MIQFIALSQGCDPAGLDVQAEVRATGTGGVGLLPPVLGRDGMGFTNEVLVSRQYRWASGRVIELRAVDD